MQKSATMANLNNMNDSSIQLMDITTLKAVLADLRKKIIPSRLEKIQQSDTHTLQIAFRTLKRLIWIEISWHADSPRIVEIQSPPPIKGESTLSKQIKYGASGMALIELKQEGFDRVIQFGLALRPKGDFQKFLLVEIMGRHSNLLLLDAKRQVITLGKQIRQTQSRLRPISTGDIYIPPPKLKGLKPNKNLSFQDWKEKLSILPPIPLKQALNETFQGISPSLSLQLVNDDKFSAQELINLPVKELSEQDWFKIYLRWIRWLKNIEEETFCLCFQGPTDYRVWRANTSSHELDEGISLELGEYYKKALEGKKLIKEFNLFSKELIKKKGIEENCLKEQQTLYTNISNVMVLQEKADSILCQENLSKENIKEAQNIYHRVKKMKRSKNVLIERINYHNEKIRFINETDLFLEYIINNSNINTIEKVESISNLKRDVEAYLCLKKNSKKLRHSPQNTLKNILQLKSPSGLDIQIGRNHNQNEFISLKKARKGDIWFHAQECPGSHVVLKASNGKVEDEDLVTGANLAAFFSKAKSNNRVSVLMVSTNQLQKLKGTAPGVVSPRGSKVLWGLPSNGQEYLEQSTKNA